MVCTGHPVRIEHVLLRTPGSDSGREPLKLAFQAVKPPARARPTAADLASYASPALLTYPTSPLPFSALISGWFSLCDRLPGVITLLCGPYYAPFIYSGHRYASTFQSAEALARAISDTRDKPPRQHRARVEAVTAALEEARLDQDTVAWAVRVMQGRNDKPLRDLTEELISSAGEMGRQLLAAMPGLPGLLASARTSVSHPGARGPGTITRYWLGEALTWVLRVVLLAELGVPPCRNQRSRRSSANYAPWARRKRSYLGQCGDVAGWPGGCFCRGGADEDGTGSYHLSEPITPEYDGLRPCAAR